MAPCQTTAPVGESLWITTLWGIPASLLVNLIWNGTPAGAVRSALSNAMPEAVSSRTVPVAPPAASGGATGTVLELTASGIAFDKADLTAPAGVPFQIKFTNNDAGIPHDVAIHKDSPAGEVVWQGEIFSGTDTRTYDVPALPAGTYGFSCTVHPNMTGTLTVK